MQYLHFVFKFLVASSSFSLKDLPAFILSLNVSICICVGGALMRVDCCQPFSSVNAWLWVVYWVDVAGICKRNCRDCLLWYCQGVAINDV